MARRAPGSTPFPYTTLFRSPSTVVILDPSAWNANSRQERTDSPSSRTVQAPQTPCSQPTWVPVRSEEHTSELQSQFHLVCRLLLEKKTLLEAQLPTDEERPV